MNGAYAVLETRGLTKRYGGVVALEDVSLTLGGAAIHGIIGPNGAGKSTLFKVLTGFTPQNAGTVTLDGTSVDGLKPAHRAKLGIIRTFQELEVFASLTVGEALTAAALLRHRLSAARERARSVAAKLELPWDERPQTLGPGLLRRLEVARCIVAEARIVLFDEVMAGLTTAETEFMMSAIERLHRDGVSIVVVEHVMNVVRRLCEHVTVIAEGQVIASGATATVTSDPRVIDAYLGRRAAARA